VAHAYETIEISNNELRTLFVHPHVDKICDSSLCGLLWRGSFFWCEIEKFEKHWTRFCVTGWQLIRE